MKNRTDFRFFLGALALSVFGLSFLAPTSALAQSELPGISGDVGMSQKSTSVYRRISRRALLSLQENKDSFFVFGEGETTPLATRLEFEKFCMDTDHSDVVSWQTKNSNTENKQRRITKITFSCVLDSDYPRIKERLFVFTFEVSGALSSRSSDPSVDPLIGEAPRLADIQIAAADIADATAADFDKAFAGSSASVLGTPAGKVAVAISGAVLSTGTTASEAEAQSKAAAPSKSITSVGKDALLAGLGAALSHFVFDVAPASSGLSGGALSIVVEDLQQKHRKGFPPAFSSTGPNRLNRNGQRPVTVYLTFKF